MMRHRSKKMRGLTLIELMVVIAIIAIMTTFAVLGMNVIYRERVASANRELLADLQKVRMDAMTQGTMGYGIRFESASSYTTFRFKDCNGNFEYNSDTCAGSAREEESSKSMSLPSSVTLKQGNPPAVPANNIVEDVIIYDKQGQPRKGDWEPFSELFIVLQYTSDASYVKCIAVTTNSIREGSWNGSSCSVQ
jgi:prepilin-type N-terminal cleavage/methylation domain-containing protein